MSPRILRPTHTDEHFDFIKLDLVQFSVIVKAVTLQRYVKGSPRYVISNCLKICQTNDNFDLKKYTLEAG